MRGIRATVDEILEEQNKKALTATLEAVEDDADKVKVTPWIAGGGCQCSRSYVIPKSAIAEIKKTGIKHPCCGKLLEVVEIVFGESATIPLADVFAQSVDATHSHLHIPPHALETIGEHHGMPGDPSSFAHEAAGAGQPPMPHFDDATFDSPYDCGPGQIYIRCGACSDCYNKYYKCIGSARFLYKQQLIGHRWGSYETASYYDNYYRRWMMVPDHLGVVCGQSDYHIARRFWPDNDYCRFYSC